MERRIWGGFALALNSAESGAEPSIEATCVAPTNDVALNTAMDRYAEGDDGAFAVVYDLLAPRLSALLRRQGCDAALCDDLLQQTFLQMHAAREHYRTGQDVIPWAFAIARRLAIDTWRRSKRETLQDAVEDERSVEGPDGDAVAKEVAERMRRAHTALSPPQREAFDLIKVEGLSLAQAAQVLGTTIAAVKLRLFRACEVLRAASDSKE